MPNDAKLGLVVGVGIVLLIAVLFFRKDPVQGQTSPANTVYAPAGPPSEASPPALPRVPTLPKEQAAPARTGNAVDPTGLPPPPTFPDMSSAIQLSPGWMRS